MDPIPIPETPVRPYSVPRSDNHPFIRAPSPAAHLLRLLSQNQSTSTAHSNGSQPATNANRSTSAPPPDPLNSSENLSASSNILSTIPQPPPPGTAPVQLPPNTSAPNMPANISLNVIAPNPPNIFPSLGSTFPQFVQPPQAPAPTFSPTSMSSVNHNHSQLLANLSNPPSPPPRSFAPLPLQAPLPVS